MPASTVTSRAAVARVARSTSPFFRRIALCAALTVLNAIVVLNFAGVLYRATSQHPVEQTGVTVLFAALLGSLVRTWFITLSDRPR